MSTITNKKLLDRLQNQQVGIPSALGKLDEHLTGLILEPKNRWLDFYFKFFSLSGKEPTTFGLALLTAALLIRRKQGVKGWSMLVAVGGGWLINQLLKRTVRRPRPLSLNSLRNHSRTFSFPSAHTNLSVCYYGMLAWLGLGFFKRPLSRSGWLLLMLGLMLMIGTSRVYRQEHHPSDVLAGYLVGSLWLSLVIGGATIYEGKDDQSSWQHKS
jgi:undecaprenyl-diphosphatase